jgi:hypothetical protein
MKSSEAYLDFSDFRVDSLTCLHAIQGLQSHQTYRIWSDPAQVEDQPCRIVLGISARQSNFLRS